MVNTNLSHEVLVYWWLLFLLCFTCSSRIWREINRMREFFIRAMMKGEQKKKQWIEAILPAMNCAIIIIMLKVILFAWSQNLLMFFFFFFFSAGGEKKRKQSLSSTFAVLFSPSTISRSGNKILLWSSGAFCTSALQHPDAQAGLYLNSCQSLTAMAEAAVTQSRSLRKRDRLQTETTSALLKFQGHKLKLTLWYPAKFKAGGAFLWFLLNCIAPLPTAHLFICVYHRLQCWGWCQQQ